MTAWGTAASLLPILVGVVLGAVVGSFIATILIRGSTGDNAFQGRSRCDACGTKVAAADLIPIISFVALGQKCRHCGAPIDKRHFQLEIAAAAIGAISFFAALGATGLATALLGWWLLLLASLDVEYQWLPDWGTLPLLAAGLLVGAADIGPHLIDRLWGAAAGYVALALIAFIYRRLRKREGLGGGDPKLLAALGAWLGWPSLPYVVIGAGIAGLSAILIRYYRGERVAFIDRLPLGTLMCLAAWPLWILMT